MAMSLNRVFLIGNLTRDPELRYVPSGTAVASFTVAVNRFYSSAAGEKKEETCFVRVVVWGRRAEVCGEYLSKGSPVFIEGRLRSRTWEGTDGQKRSTIEVIASSVQFLRSSSKTALPPDESGVDEKVPEDAAVDQGAKGQEAKGAEGETPAVPGEEVPF